MGSCAAPSAKGDDKFITTDYLQQCLLIADLDMALITKRKRMMDSVGHYARPELLSLRLDNTPARYVVTRETEPETGGGRDAEHTVHAPAADY